MTKAKSSDKDAPVKSESRSPGSTAASEAILDAALQEFSNLGFQGCSVRNIGKRAEVDFTLITYYFKTKENLWKAVITRGLEKHYEIVKRHMEAAENGSPGAKLKARIRGELDFAYSEHSVFRLVMIDNSSDSSRGKWLIDNFLYEKHKSAIKLVKDAQASGEIPAGDPAVLTNVMQLGLRSMLFIDQQHSPLAENYPKKDTIEKIWEVFNATFFRDVADTPGS
jgi:AcrR family transcriptional regulator